MVIKSPNDDLKRHKHRKQTATVGKISKSTCHFSSLTVLQWPDCLLTAKGLRLSISRNNVQSVSTENLISFSYTPKKARYNGIMKSSTMGSIGIRTGTLDLVQNPVVKEEPVLVLGKHPCPDPAVKKPRYRTQEVMSSVSTSRPKTLACKKQIPTMKSILRFCNLVF